MRSIRYFLVFYIPAFLFSATPSNLGEVLAVRPGPYATPTPRTKDPAHGRDAVAEFNRLLELQISLKNVRSENTRDESVQKFIKANESDIVYNDPSAEYFVRSERFWELFERHRTLPIAEEIAWAAAQNPLSGECEGYLNCYLYTALSTEGRYLRNYPEGKYSKAALRNLPDLLKGVATDPAGGTGPTDPSDKSELMGYLRELTETLSAVNGQEKTSILGYVKMIGEKYR